MRYPRSPWCFGHYVIPKLSLVPFHSSVDLIIILKCEKQSKQKECPKIWLVVYPYSHLPRDIWKSIATVFFFCQKRKIYNNKLAWALFHPDNVTPCPEGGDRHASFVAKPLITLWNKSHNTIAKRTQIKTKNLLKRHK